MKPIRTSLAVVKEIALAVMTAICGHAPDPLSPRAKRVYRKWREAEFKPELLPFKKEG